MMWKIIFTHEAEKDKRKIKGAGLEEKTKKLLNLMMINPFQTPPSYEKLVGDLSGYYSRRINVKHRLVYRILEDKHIIVIHAMWTHYGDN